MPGHPGLCQGDLSKPVSADPNAAGALTAAVPRPPGWWRIYWHHRAELDQNKALRYSQAQAEGASERFVTLFSNVPLALMVVDERGQILENNALEHWICCGQWKTIRR